MLCERCKQNEATVYVSQVVNGQTTEHYLCDDCVKKGEKDMGTQAILFNNFISELMKIALEDGYIKSPNPPAQKRCSRCGLSLKEFLEIGRFGCTECYTTFNNELKNAFTNVHGNTKHVGKIIASPEISSVSSEEELPRTMLNRRSDRTEDESIEEKIKRLESRLKEAVKEEAYEEAARLRDEIRALKQGGEK